MNVPLFSMAFMTGLLGSAHCLGMCGGLVAALAMTGQQMRAGFAFQLFYHLGRLLTYTLLGAAVGWLGSALAFTDQVKDLTRLLLVCSDLFIMLVGLGSLGALPTFSLIGLESKVPLPALGRAVQRLLRLPSALAALPLGLLLGFLPCGFVYAMAISAAQTTSSVDGAILMGAFGLGTLPALLGFGSVAQWLSQSARVWMLRGAGLLVLLMGTYQLVRHLQLMGVISSPL